MSQSTHPCSKGPGYENKRAIGEPNGLIRENEGTPLNYKMTISYDGSRYLGWQRQKGSDQTIQGKIEAVISRLFDNDIEIIGSGRTDAGVHAKGQVANFIVDSIDLKSNKLKGRLADAGIPLEIINSIESPSTDLSKVWQKYINHYLPDDISIVSMEEVNERFHSRYLVKKKHYRYSILNSDISDVFDRKYVFQLDDHLDIELMRKASECFVGEHDFAAFTSLKNNKKSTVRLVTDIKITEAEVPGGRRIDLDFEGEGFLYNMVRIMVGTLVEVGKKDRTPESVKDVLSQKVREKAGFMAPAKGLCLMEVEY